MIYQLLYVTFYTLNRSALGKAPPKKAAIHQLADSCCCCCWNSGHGPSFPLPRNSSHPSSANRQLPAAGPNSIPKFVVVVSAALEETMKNVNKSEADFSATRADFVDSVGSIWSRRVCVWEVLSLGVGRAFMRCLFNLSFIELWVVGRERSWEMVDSEDKGTQKMFTSDCT